VLLLTVKRGLGRSFFGDKILIVIRASKKANGRAGMEADATISVLLAPSHFSRNIFSIQKLDNFDHICVAADGALHINVTKVGDDDVCAIPHLQSVQALQPRVPTDFDSPTEK
jgi:hypothetical protein